MVYAWAALLVAAALVCASGCTEGPEETPTPAPTSIPVPPVYTTPEPSADMALRPQDLPSGYELRDRSVIAPGEVPSLALQLGWREGYHVTYERENRYTDDVTLIRQSVNIYTTDSIEGVFLLAKEELKDQQVSPGSRYEIPFPPAGERSIAFRDTNPLDPEHSVTYTAIFMKKNVFEKISMTGTNTDYETFKRLVLRADALVL